MLAWAKNAEEFRRRVMEALNYYNLDFVDMEDVEPFHERQKKIPMGKILHQKAAEVEATHLVRFNKKVDVHE